MNHKEHTLGELELRPLHAKEALQCMLHSILFLRAPNVVRPREVCLRVLIKGEKGERHESKREEREGRLLVHPVGQGGMILLTIVHLINES